MPQNVWRTPLQQKKNCRPSSGRLETSTGQSERQLKARTTEKHREKRDAAATAPAVIEVVEEAGDIRGSEDVVGGSEVPIKKLTPQEKRKITMARKRTEREAAEAAEAEAAKAPEAAEVTRKAIEDVRVHKVAEGAIPRARRARKSHHYAILNDPEAAEGSSRSKRAKTGEGTTIEAWSEGYTWWW